MDGDEINAFLRKIMKEYQGTWSNMLPVFDPDRSHLKSVKPERRKVTKQSDWEEEKAQIMKKSVGIPDEWRDAFGLYLDKQHLNKKIFEAHNALKLVKGYKIERKQPQIKAVENAENE